MRSATVRAARATFCAGSVDSDAASVATSLPIIEKIVTGTAANTAPAPFGISPPSLVRFAPAVSRPGPKNSRKARPSRTKTAIAETLRRANQNSNSP
jgi:hypothetical protein